MITPEDMLTIGAALSVAEVVDIKADSDGYAECELVGNNIRFIFSVDPECKLTLFEIKCFDFSMSDLPPYFDEIDELNRAIDWETIFYGSLYDKIHKEWENAAGGSYYDFWLEEYEPEETEIYN